MATAATATQWSNRPSRHTTEATSRHSSSRDANASYDRFYGHKDLAELCESVIMALFDCPLDSTSSNVHSPITSARPAPRLSEFIAYALHRTRLPLAVTHQALFLLKRLKSRFPAARGSSGHRLFISALMLASKSSCDDTYSNKSWTIVGQGLFSLREVNQMERELFGYLGFKVNVEHEELVGFVDGLQQGRIQASIEVPSPDPSVCSSTTSTAATSTTTTISSPSVSSLASCSSSTLTSNDVCSVASAAVAKPQRPVVSTRSSSQHYPYEQEAFATSRATIPGYLTYPAAERPAPASISEPALSRCDSSNNTTVEEDFFYPYNDPQHRFGRIPLQRTSMDRRSQAQQSPSTASLSSSCRASISSSSGLTPSPSADSRSGSSSCTSPDTPPSELASSPWDADEKTKVTSSGVPGQLVIPPTYDGPFKFYNNHVVDQQQQHHQHSSASAATFRQESHAHHVTHQHQHSYANAATTAAAAAAAAAVAATTRQNSQHPPYPWQ